MKTARNVLLALVTGGLMAMTAPASAVPQSSAAPSVTEGKSGGSGSSGESIGQGQTKHKRESSGKHIQEYPTTDDNGKAGKGASQGSGTGSTGSRSPMGSGGGGVSGPMGK